MELRMLLVTDRLRKPMPTPSWLSTPTTAGEEEEEKEEEEEDCSIIDDDLGRDCEMPPLLLSSRLDMEAAPP
jgi:hypothetical protein